MIIWLIILLGIIQGLTEFLPISSSGHLVLFERLFQIEGDLIFLNVILHLGTLIAVCVYYRSTVWQLIKHPFSKEVGYLVIATIPAVVVVLLFRSFIESSFGGQYLAVGFMVTATILTVTSLVLSNKDRKVKPFTYKTALIMGLFQGLAVLPGISRSGSTIAGGIFCGVPPERAANFSFLMSIPIILASLVFECFKLSSSSFEMGILPLSLGFIAAFIFGFLAITVTLKLVKRAKFYPFIIYLVLLSAVLIIFRF